MKRAIDGENLKLALDHATDMLRELKSNTLTPRNYYDLYMKVAIFETNNFEYDYYNNYNYCH